MYYTPYRSNSPIEYLVPDFERMHNHDEVWTNCSVAVSGLDRKLNEVFPFDCTFLTALDCHKFIKRSTEGEFSIYSSIESMRMHSVKKEVFVESLFDTLNMKRGKNNVQLVAYNVDHDEDILKNMFHECGYPYYYDDKNFPNGDGREGPFTHLTYDLMQVGIRHKAFKLSQGEFTKVRLVDTARSLGIPVQENRLHDARYDCWLAVQIFRRDQELNYNLAA